MKAVLDDLGTLTAVYRQAHVPDDAVFPYASFLDPISDSPVLSGDARTLARRRVIQVDLWQDEDDEDDDLLDSVVNSIDGSRASGGLTFRVQDVSLVPGPEEDQGIVHHAITVGLPRLR